MSAVVFGLGVALALAAGFLMWFGVLPTASRIVMLIVGIGLIATSSTLAAGARKP
jgi:hypothetical protein